MFTIEGLPKKQSAMYRKVMSDLKTFTPIGLTNWRNQNLLFGIKPSDRLHHIYCIGKTGTGKSTLLINMALDDISKGYGVCVIDPHSETVEAIAKRIPHYRKNDMVYFDATNREKLPAFNPLHNVPEHQRQLVASEMITTFRKLFENSWGDKLEYILRFCILTLLEYPNGTLLDITALLLDRDFRSNVLNHVQSHHILTFWKKEFEGFTQSVQTASVLPLLNKVGVLLGNDTLRGIFGQQESISISDCMKYNKVLLCNLSKGVIGEDICVVLGSFITTTIQALAMRRANVPPYERPVFYLYIDEAHSFVSDSFANMLSEVRKFGVGIFLTHQYLDQLEPNVRSSILGNVGSIICFRLGLSDAKVMEKEFYPVFRYDDFINLPRYNIYLKLLIDGAESKGFSAVTLN